MSKLLGLLTILTIFCCAYSQLTEERLDQIKRIVQTVCSPNIPADKAKIVRDCDSKISKNFRTAYSGCVKDVLKVPKITQTMVCYRLMPNGDKLFSCMERKGQAALKKNGGTAGLSAGIVRQRIGEYIRCMGKVLQ